MTYLHSWIFLWITCQTSHNSNNFFVRITYHFLNRQMAFHLCGSLHDFFNYPFLEITNHIWNRKWLLHSCIFKTLKMHERIHTGEKLFACFKFDKWFKKIKLCNRSKLIVRIVKQVHNEILKLWNRSQCKMNSME